MTKLLDHAIARLRELPSERQDEAAELLLNMIDEGIDVPRLTDEQVAEVVRRLREPPEYVDHSDVRAFFHKPGA
jgi:hypothetical protein